MVDDTIYQSETGRSSLRGAMGALQNLRQFSAALQFMSSPSFYTFQANLDKKQLKTGTASSSICRAVDSYHTTANSQLETCDTEVISQFRGNSWDSQESKSVCTTQSMTLERSFLSDWWTGKNLKMKELEEQGVRNIYFEEQ